MRRSLLMSVCLATCALAWLTTATDAVAAPPVNTHATQHILIKTVAESGDPRVESNDAFTTATQTWNVDSIAPVFHTQFHDPDLAKQIGLDRLFRVTVPEGTDVHEMIDAFAQLPNVKYAELDGIGGIAEVLPDDPDFIDQWALRNTGQTGGTPGADINATDAWELETGSSNPVTIAIIDSGVSPHPEFDARMVPGINTADPEDPANTSDGCPHGTHVAGIAAATGNNGQGIAGMSWEANIMPVRVLNTCNGNESQCAAGIVWAADNGADICNMSLQYYAGTQTLRDAVDYAHGLGVTLVAAAGNQQGAIVAFPARFENCIAVSATNHDDALYQFSNVGDEITLSAPGEEIWSTWLGNGYEFLSGTSMASPHVAGTAALMLSADPLLSPGEITDVLVNTATDLGSQGWDNIFGHGRIDAAEAVSAIVDPLSVGACCNVDDCEVTFADECTHGNWFAGTACLASPCPIAPQAEALGPKVISITIDPANDQTPTAIAIRATDWTCPAKFVVPAETYAELQDEPVFTASSEWGSFEVADIEITPGTTFEVWTNYGSYVSDSVFVTTWRWGDVDNSTVNNFADIQLTVLAFQGVLNYVTIEAADVWPCAPNRVVNFEDIFRVIQAFQGDQYEDTSCADPCD